jgi:16S rRNA (uracil1498-N3)-methyltransferase
MAAKNRFAGVPAIIGPWFWRPAGGRAKAEPAVVGCGRGRSMSRYDFRTPRLHVEAPLSAGAVVALERPQAHYLTTVLRLKSGDGVLVFNGRDGEWQATIEPQKRATVLHVGANTRPQTEPSDLHYLFAPLKAARLDYMVQKAVEMGVSHLQPVLTRHTQVARVNAARMRANAIEAAEQCGILTLPQIGEPAAFFRVLHALGSERCLIFCDEDAELADPVAALGTVAPFSPLAVLIGPEGGFADDERAALSKRPNVVRLALGPRILRADTAAVAALVLVQAVLGDWRGEGGQWRRREHR